MQRLATQRQREAEHQLRFSKCEQMGGWGMVGVILSTWRTIDPELDFPSTLISSATLVDKPKYCLLCFLFRLRVLLLFSAAGNMSLQC